MVKKQTKNPVKRDGSILSAGLQTITYYTGAGSSQSHRAYIDVRPEEEQTRILDSDYNILDTVRSIKRKDVQKALRGMKRKELIDQELDELLVHSTPAKAEQDDVQKKK